MLALVGSGEYLPSIATVDRVLIDRLSETARVVCLPTAAGKESAERVEYWSKMGVDHFSRLGAQVQAVRLIDRGEARDQHKVMEIAAANFVYFSGGDPYYLYQTLKDTPAWEAIMDVHLRGGIVAGCSAGAMIMGERILGLLRLPEAFGLLPGTVVVPHYDEIPSWVVRVIRLRAANDLKLVGIEGSTALVASKDGFEVLGKGYVTIWNGKQVLKYSAHQRPVLSQL